MSELENPSAPEVSDKEVVLLGLIAEEPSHAYGLQEAIRERRMTEWTDISPSSVYRVLSGLEKRGFLEGPLAHAGQGAPRKVHRQTEPGRAALAAAVLARLADLQPQKTPYALGLAFARRAPRPEVRECLQRRAAAVRQMGDQLLEVGRWALAAASEPSATADRSPLGVRLLFAHLEHHLRAELTFLDEAQEILAEEESS